MIINLLMNYHVKADLANDRINISDDCGNVCGTFDAGCRLESLTTEQRQELANKFMLRFKTETLAGMKLPDLQQRVDRYICQLLPSLVAVKEQYSTSPDRRGAALFAIAAQTEDNLVALQKAVQLSLNFLSWPARNLYELYLWAYYAVHLDQGKGKECVLANTYADAKQLHETLFKMAPMPTPDMISQRDTLSQQLEIEAQNNGVEIPAKPLAKSGLVDKVRNHNASLGADLKADEGFYKLTSKYLHPTAFNFLHDATDSVDLNYRQIILKKALSYADKTVQVLGQAI